jgi:hypothetical protein
VWPTAVIFARASALATLPTLTDPEYVSSGSRVRSRKSNPRSAKSSICYTTSIIGLFIAPSSHSCPPFG